MYTLSIIKTMNTHKIYSLLLAALSVTALTTSCDDYLDKLPDDRAEVNTIEKAKSLLTSAYTLHTPDYIMEYSSDNVTDNGRQYTSQPNQDQLYRWQDVETEGNDDPRSYWSTSYTAVGTANEALSALSKLGDGAEVKELRAEGLLCRAWDMFRLSNVFCMAYNPEKADSLLGLPYPTEPNVSVDERGSLKQLYENINKDIEEALPLVGDAHLTVPKYHFNTKAAYAFAARFNLFYHNYDKAIEYATKALGNDPSSVLRQTAAYDELAGVDDKGNAWIKSSEPANLMLQPATSTLGRSFLSSSYARYATNREITTYETYWARTPWSPNGGSTNNTLYESHMLYGNDRQVYMPKMMEIFEVTDKINDTGYAHIVDAVLTGDETLLVRAEAYVMKGEYDKALADMNSWVMAHTAAMTGTATRPTLTVDNINSFINGLTVAPSNPTSGVQRTMRKVLHPQGFSLKDETQTNLILMVLQMRRVETWQQGQRFMDLKRWGIEFAHSLDGEDALIFKAGDKRGAIQIPSDVVDAGLEPNPRD